MAGAVRALSGARRAGRCGLLQSEAFLQGHWPVRAVPGRRGRQQQAKARRRGLALGPSVASFFHHLVSMPLAHAGICLDDVTLVRGATTVFEHLSLELREPRIGLVGDNGAGKSSLFRLACGLDLARSGRVLVAGEAPGKGPVGRIGMMFQSPDEQIIFPTVDEELALGLTAQGLSRQQAQTRAAQWLASRGLAHWVGRAISSLSQGQRQHVCWLALLIAAPHVLLLDEPFASLDLPGQALLRQEIAQAPQQVLVSTHLLDQVRDFERVIWLEQGRVRADGPGARVCAQYEADIARRVHERSLSIDGVAPTTAS